MRMFAAAAKLMLALLIACTAVGARAQGGHEGRWVLDAGGRTLFLLELTRDRRAPGGWTGGLTMPRHYQTSAAADVFSHVSGPISRAPIVAAQDSGEVLELTIGKGPKPDIILWRLNGQDAGELSFKGVPLPALLMRRGTPQSAVAADWDANRSYVVARQWPSNPEIAALFAADQAPRTSGKPIVWEVVAREDEARRVRTKALVDSGALQSGDDFYYAAFIFQHGGDPSAYLMAHTFAVIAAARGRPDAAWIAAASLDRYLQSIGQKQIYGTQFKTLGGEATTQEPYDRALVSDALRATLGVPSQADQEKRRADMSARNAPQVKPNK